MMEPKTKAEIAILKEGGKRLGRIRDELVREVKPGVTAVSLDRLANDLIKKAGGEPSFRKVPGYRWATCICPNEVVVHGVPDRRPFKPGDIVGIDIGLFYGGFHTDTAVTVLVGGESKDSLGKKRLDYLRTFLDTGKKALAQAIKIATAGRRIGHISRVIQQTVEEKGYSIIRTLVGHGIGKKLHESPEVPGFLNQPIEKTPMLVAGMALAIEVIYTLGKAEVLISPRDGWTVKTKDGSLAALFEHTVLVDKQTTVLTR